MPQNNIPDLWIKSFPRRSDASHKYDFGHAVIFGAPKMTGATRLAAEACARIGAGLTTVVAEEKAAWVYRETLAAHVIVEDLNRDIATHFEDARRNAVLAGPGGGKDFAHLCEIIETVCGLNKKFVIDADALNALAEKYIPLNSNCVLTPHEGEFAKLFPDLKGSREERAVAAAQKTKAVIVLKGHETVIAGTGAIAVNSNAPANLATAGTGDVLAGMITGLLAQGMAPFEAACAGVWMHGEAARAFGPGLVASDLITKIPSVLAEAPFKP